MIFPCAALETGCSVDLDFQQTCMEMFIGAKRTILKVCDWTFVECDHAKIVRVIHCKKLRHCWDLRWLPNTVKNLNLFDQDVRGKLETNILPLELKDCNLGSCGLEGSIDLTTLPPNLEIFKVDQNFFTGDITLTRLPESMLEMSLHDNAFRNVFFDQGALPDDFRSVTFSKKHKHVRLNIVRLRSSGPDKRIRFV